MSKRDSTCLAPLKIFVSPAPSGASRYVARLANDDRILCVSRTPFLDAARELVANGYDPSVTLIMCHAGSDTAGLRAKLRIAATLTVEETDFGPKLRGWKPFSTPEGSSRIAPNIHGDLSQRGNEKDRRQPHGPRRREPTSQSETVPSLRGQDARRFTVPMPRAIHGRTRCRLHGGLSPGAPRGPKNGNFKNGDWTFGLHRGAEMAAVARAVLCNNGEVRMTQKPNNVSKLIDGQRRPPVRIKLLRVDARVAQTGPPDGERSRLVATTAQGAWHCVYPLRPIKLAPASGRRSFAVWHNIRNGHERRSGNDRSRHAER